MKVSKAQREATRTARMEVAIRLEYDKRRAGKWWSRCEGTLHKDHRCHGRPELNEVIYPRNIFQKLSPEEQMYFWHVINSAFNCSFFHSVYGHRTSYRDWHVQRMIDIYGLDVVKEWCEGAPLEPENIVRVDHE